MATENSIIYFSTEISNRSRNNIDIGNRYDVLKLPEEFIFPVIRMRCDGTFLLIEDGSQSIWYKDFRTNPGDKDFLRFNTSVQDISDFIVICTGQCLIVVLLNIQGDVYLQSILNKEVQESVKIEEFSRTNLICRASSSSCHSIQIFKEGIVYLVYLYSQGCSVVYHIKKKVEFPDSFLYAVSCDKDLFIDEKDRLWTIERNSDKDQFPLRREDIDIFPNIMICNDLSDDSILTIDRSGYLYFIYNSCKEDGVAFYSKKIDFDDVVLSVCVEDRRNKKQVFFLDNEGKLYYLEIISKRFDKSLPLPKCLNSWVTEAVQDYYNDTLILYKASKTRRLDSIPYADTSCFVRKNRKMGL